MSSSYALNIGEYRYDIRHCPEGIAVRCAHIGSGVVAEARHRLQYMARMLAKARVDQIRGGEV